VDFKIKKNSGVYKGPRADSENRRSRASSVGSIGSSIYSSNTEDMD
jgi:hypothetical protein